MKFEFIKNQPIKPKIGDLIVIIRGNDGFDKDDIKLGKQGFGYYTFFGEIGNIVEVQDNNDCYLPQYRIKFLNKEIQKYNKIDEDSCFYHPLGWTWHRDDFACIKIK